MASSFSLENVQQTFQFADVSAIGALTSHQQTGKFAVRHAPRFSWFLPRRSSDMKNSLEHVAQTNSAAQVCGPQAGGESMRRLTVCATTRPPVFIVSPASSVTTR
jgi:hypothetical protein